MPYKLSKKNSDYSKGERRVTAVICFVVFALLTFYYANSFNFENEFFKLASPYLFAAAIATLVGIFSYKYPKVIHLTIFALPLMFVGS
ncbi:hypothetical protein [Shewanella fidelis]|uniref:hypothetical protein n=1 Tax=Shewanella fidelis TaxID=173509 RepID=UPI00048E210D|nr:hypothetical protein [Shewanella fidelis]